MELHHLRCFVAAAEELHFGRAAQRLDMLPAALGRHVRLLEEGLGVQLFLRTTRSVSLTEDGAVLLREAKGLLEKADAIASRFRERSRARTTLLRIGAIDTASAGLIPALLHDFRSSHPTVSVELIEDKTVRLLPRLLSGRIDLAFVRPPEHFSRQIEMSLLFHETPVVAVQSHHPLAQRRSISISALAEEHLIVPDRRSRPHSHDLTIKLFEQAKMRPIIAQIAEEKQTIVSLVATGLGIALVPRWTARMAVPGVRYIRLSLRHAHEKNILPLAAAWVRHARDPIRDQMLEMLSARLGAYARGA